MVMIYVFVCIKMKGDKEVIGVGGLSISDALRSKFNGKTSTIKNHIYIYISSFV